MQCYPQRYLGGKFGITITYDFGIKYDASDCTWRDITVRNIDLETHKPIEKMVADDFFKGALQLVDATFLTAKLFITDVITDGQDPSKSLKFLK